MSSTVSAAEGTRYASPQFVQTQSLQLLASGQKEEVQAAIALITTEINQQLAAIEPYQYQLIFDPTESRAVLLEALT
jgi:uncharacterized protein YciW